VLVPFGTGKISVVLIVKANLVTKTATHSVPVSFSSWRDLPFERVGGEDTCHLTENRISPVDTICHQQRSCHAESLVGVVMRRPRTTKQTQKSALRRVSFLVCSSENLMHSSDDELVLKFDNDAYEGVLVFDTSQFATMDELVFGRYLKSSIKRWRRDKKKGVWLKVLYNYSQ
jgi:hypothetical protein